jgi:pyroglutamyl-peptidase
MTGAEGFMRILLTGFEPFGKHKINPSEEVVRRLAESRVEGIELNTAILAVHRTSGPEKLIRAFEESRPDAVLLLGEAGGYPVPTLERMFVNLLEYPAELGGGVAVIDEPLKPDGPAAYISTLPVREIYDNVLKAGIPCRLSLSAGTYICNQVGYVIHDHIRRNNFQVIAGLMHLPFLPEQAATLAAAGAWPSMTVETLTRCVSLALESIAMKKTTRML